MVLFAALFACLTQTDVTAIFTKCALFFFGNKTVKTIGAATILTIINIFGFSLAFHTSQISIISQDDFTLFLKFELSNVSCRGLSAKLIAFICQEIIFSIVKTHLLENKGL